MDIAIRTQLSGKKGWFYMPDFGVHRSTVGISLSGDALLTYKSGGGFLPAPNNGPLPAAFKSLNHLKSWWSTPGNYSSLGGSTVYSLNSVSPDTAIIVLPDSPLPLPPLPDPKAINPWLQPNYWLLYMAPSVTGFAHHYITTYLKAPVLAGTGPVVKGLKIAKYVVIGNNPSVISQWYFDCAAAHNNLTSIAAGGIPL